MKTCVFKTFEVRPTRLYPRIIIRIWVIWEDRIPWLNIPMCTWWRHQMETFSALLALCAGNSPITSEFPSQRPVTRNFDDFFDLRLNKLLGKQSWGWWNANNAAILCIRITQVLTRFLFGKLAIDIVLDIIKCFQATLHWIFVQATIKRILKWVCDHIIKTCFSTTFLNQLISTSGVCPSFAKWFYVHRISRLSR